MRHVNKSNELPEFNSLIRQLYRKAHPDLLRAQYPELARVNDSSMQELNGVLSCLKSVTTEYPPAIEKRLIFNIKNQAGEYKEYKILIKTSGGECRKQLRTLFASFFRETGICTTDFVWGKDFFPTGIVETDSDSVK